MTDQFEDVDIAQLFEKNSVKNLDSDVSAAKKPRTTPVVNIILSEDLHLVELKDSTDGEITAVHLRSPINPDFPRKHVYNGEVGNWQLDDTEFLETFRLPGPGNKNDMLETINLSYRDSRIEFFEDSHKYIIDGGIRAPRSVTSLVHQFVPEFDADLIISKMRNGKNWVQKKREYTLPDGRIMSDEEIKQGWEKNKNVASSRGTLLHWHCENYLNGSVIHGPFSTEFSYFIDFYKNFMMPRGLEPYRTEFSIFHTGLACAGQIDLLARYQGTDTYVILDWKRSKKIQKTNFFEKLKAPIDYLDNANVNVYSLQLNMYRFILTTEYGLFIPEMYLVFLHESHEACNVTPVDIMQNEIDKIVEYERLTRNTRQSQAGKSSPFSVDHLTNIC